MHSQDAAHYHYVHRKTVDSSIHGRVSTIPARLTGYGEVWDGDECTLFCEGVVQQSTVFGEDLHLIRRIEAKVGGNEILLKDRVVNHGFYRTPHMLCYHINVGHPVLAEGSRYLAPIEHVGLGVARREPTAPRASATGPCRRRERRSTSRSGSIGWRPTATGACRWRWSTTASTAAAAWASWSRPASASSPASSSGRTTRPASTRWASSPRPTTSSASRSREERGELIWLEHGEERSYTTRMAVLDGARRRSRPRSSGSARSPCSRTRTIPSRPGAGTPVG